MNSSGWHPAAGLARAPGKYRIWPGHNTWAALLRRLGIKTDSRIYYLSAILSFGESAWIRRVWRAR